jgi:CLIP-associating protein 1/2
LRTQTSITLPLLVDKLGDAKERNKTVALAAIIDTHRHHPQDVEKAMKELGFGSKNARVRLESIRWLAQTHALNPAFSFKSYTPLLIGMLEDSNEPVREAAKNIVVELFRYVVTNRCDR